MSNKFEKIKGFDFNKQQKDYWKSKHKQFERKEKVEKLKVWANENKETIIALAPMVLVTITNVIRFTNKRVNLRKEQNLKDLYIYDHSHGHYWKLKKKLSADQWIEIDNRKAKGEILCNILNDMNVLK